MSTSPLPTLRPSRDREPEAEPTPVEQLRAELVRLQRSRLLLEQRERQLLQALGQASAERLGDLLTETGVAPASLEGLMRRTVGHSARPAGAETGAAGHAQVRKAPLRFRHPDEPGLVWSGRGKTPAWIKDLEAQGRLAQARLAQDEQAKPHEQVRQDKAGSP